MLICTYEIRTKARNREGQRSGMKDFLSLREYYKTRKIGMFFGDKAKVFSYIKENPDPECLKLADALCENTFLFNQPWDMEKCMDPVMFQDKIDWSYTHNHDREWMWMLNRQNYWICLMQAYVATDDEKYLNTFLVQIEQWLDSEKDPEGKAYTTWRTIDVGIRLKNWVKILEYIIDLDQLSERLFQKIVASVYEQLKYLMNSYKREYALTNWRILEFHGALIASIYFREFEESETWILQCIEILEECLLLQVTKDGFHWEQSYMYHVEMLLCMKDVILICRRNHIALPELLIFTTKKMADAVTHMITPRGTQPCYGDSDIEDVRELIFGLSLLFEDEEYAFHGREYRTVNLVCDYGEPALLEDGFIKGKEPQQRDYAHEDVGNYFVRSSWREDAGYLFFKNGFIGSGHGHCDLLHFEIYASGNPILVDSGRYTYREDTPDRQLFKSAKAHNTLLVDNEECIVQDGSWGNQTTAMAIKRPAVLNQEVCFVQGAHMGYKDKGVFINRKIIYIKPHIWIITDECFSNQPHVYSQYYHFAKDSVEIKGNQVIYTDDKQKFTLSVMQDSHLRKETVEISPAYNHKYNSAGVVVEREGTQDTYMTAIGFSEEREAKSSIQKAVVLDMSKKEIDSRFVSAFKITAKEEEWLVLMNHQEEETRRQIYIVEDILVYGRTAVIHRKGDVISRHILEY